MTKEETRVVVQKILENIEKASDRILKEYEGGADVEETPFEIVRGALNFVEVKFNEFIYTKNETHH